MSAHGNGKAGENGQEFTPSPKDKAAAEPDPVRLRATEEKEEMADLIWLGCNLNWKAIKKELQKTETKALMALMLELEFYVNKTLALELAKRKDAVFWIRRAMQDMEIWNRYQEVPITILHLLYVLALIKSKEALQLLLDAVKYRSDDLGNWLHDDVPDILVAFGEGAIEQLKEFSADETVYADSRDATIEALARLARKHPARKEELKEFLLNLLRTTDDRMAAGVVAQNLGTFHDPSVLPEVHRAFEEGRIADYWEEDAIKWTIEGREEDYFEECVEDPLEHFSRENIQDLEEDDGFSEPDDFLDEESEGFNEETEDLKIGRNDLCPCGSGKKYKKCCLGRSALKKFREGG